MNLNHRITSLKQANDFLNTVTNGNLKLNKGKDYFYFTSEKGFIPKSFMCKSIKSICLDDLIDAKNEFIKNAK